ncbi:MAG: hypothetical protein ACM3JB_22615 [Acidobacteriaceae bacterium]
MKKVLAALLLAIPLAGFAQDQAPAVRKDKGAQFTANIPEFRQQPTYSDIYCSGFVTKEHIPDQNHVLAGMNAPNSVRLSERDTVYLVGPGYAVGNRYSVVRKVSDPNKYESLPGQHALLAQSGSEYFDLGRIVITYIDKEVAVGQIEFSCQPMSPGDILLPFQEREMVKFREAPVQFERFAPMGSTSGRIIDGKDFDQFLGTGQKAYVNLGANKGVHPGDYLRIVRNYDPGLMYPVDRFSLAAPYESDESQNNLKLTNGDYKKLPYRGIGEMVVLSVTPDTATAMITHALEDIQVGDVVEVEGAK